MVAPTDPYAVLRYNMIKGESFSAFEREYLILTFTVHTWGVAHNVLKLGFDNILEHLENPPSDDLKNFLGYCQAWADSLHGHHDAEGKPIFLHSFIRSAPY